MITNIYKLLVTFKRLNCLAHFCRHGFRFKFDRGVIDDNMFIWPKVNSEPEQDEDIQ